MNIKRSVMNDTLNKLTARKNAPTVVFVILILLVILASVVNSSTAGVKNEVNIFGVQIPINSLTGVFSALSEICVIFMPVFCGKKGYFTALFLQIIQLPMIIIGIITRNSMSSIPGVFGNILTIIAITIIYINNKKVNSYQEELRDQAVTDRLTGLPNRFAGSTLINDLIEKGDKFAIVSIDINGFKGINDTMGFDAGNRVLCEISSRWKEIADTRITGTLDFIIRLSSDEFVLVIRDYKSDEDIMKTIEQYEAVLNNRLTVDDCDFYITASFGYVEFPSDANNIDSLFSFADAAMHEVKRAKSSNHILRFTPELLKIERKLEIEREIRDALENDTLFFNLQPQYDMNHKLRGFEALARMKDSEGTFISPGEFIPIAEQVGLVDKVDGIVFRKSAMFLGEILRKTNIDIVLSFNVSVRHLMKNDFLDEVRNVLQCSGVPAKQLEIEITESIMIDSVDKALKCIDEIRAIGVNIAIDDFGTGFSSLSYLNKFPANILKVDKSFIDEMNNSESSKQYVSSIISIGHIMEFDVIAEGVEKLEQIESLKEIGCDYIQGYVWGRPLSKEDAEELIMKEVNKDSSL